MLRPEFKAKPGKRYDLYEIVIDGAGRSVLGGRNMNRALDNFDDEGNFIDPLDNERKKLEWAIYQGSDNKDLKAFTWEQFNKMGRAEVIVLGYNPLESEKSRFIDGEKG